MNRILYKIGIYGVVIFYIFFITKLYISQSNEVRDLRDIRTTELLQIDSLEKVHTVTVNQFKNIILEKDSIFKSEIQKRDIKIKNLNSASKLEIKEIIVPKDSIIIKEVKTDRDTILDLTTKLNCITLHQKLEIKNSKVNLALDSLQLNFRITVLDYNEVIKWYNFKKRRKHGFNLIGFRNHYINKITATSDCFKDKIKIDIYKVKK